MKRFAILTGISGTGKTQIARKLAAQFAVKRRVEIPADPGDAALLMTVRPYMRKYHRIILPRALAARLQVPPKAGPATLPARWPGGDMDLSAYVDDSIAVLFRGEMRTWFDKSFGVGDDFVVRVDGGNGQPNILVFDAVTVYHSRGAHSERDGCRCPT